MAIGSKVYLFNLVASPAKIPQAAGSVVHTTSPMGWAHTWALPVAARIPSAVVESRDVYQFLYHSLLILSIEHSVHASMEVIHVTKTERRLARFRSENERSINGSAIAGGFVLALQKIACSSARPNWVIWPKSERNFTTAALSFRPVSIHWGKHGDRMNAREDANQSPNYPIVVEQRPKTGECGTSSGIA